MPYIPQDQREGVDAGSKPIHPGELNYLISKTCWEYLTRRGFPRPGEGGYPYSYADLNEVIGVLECAKQELYRRVLAPYEDGKKQSHRDVFVRPEED